MALVDRVKNILLTPKTEWQVIDAEPTTVADLYKGYIIPLAAIGPICTAIGWSVFGMRVPFLGTYRTPIGDGAHQRRGPVRPDADRRLRAGDHHRQAGADLQRHPEHDPGAQGGGLRLHGELGRGDLRRCSRR